MNKYSVIFLVFIVAFCIFGPFFTPYSISDVDLSITKQGISIKHLLGTDKVGRDVLTSLMYGGRMSLLIGLSVSLITTIIGTSVGVISGYFGGKFDNLFMAITDIIMCIPLLGVVLLIGAFSYDFIFSDYAKVVALIFILSGLMWTTLARLIRSRTIILSKADYVTVAKMMGVSNLRIIFVHIVPMLIPYILSNATLIVADAIMSESALSFLGIGVSPTYPTWGNIVQNVTDMDIFINYPLMWVPAGLCICGTIVAINMIGVDKYALDRIR